jgi:transcriptional regulator with XRE-family HTH domain
MSYTLTFIMKPVQKPHASLGSLVRTKREAMGLSQQALADQAGVSRESVNRLENATGTWAPRPRKVAQILLVLEITVPEVTDTVDDPELYVELVSEMDRLAAADFRAYVTQQRTGWPVAGPATQADLIMVSPDGTTCIVEVKGARKVKHQVAGDLAAALGEAGWIVSATV